MNRELDVDSRAKDSKAQVPADFVWGVSTSSYQIEGATQADGRGASVWDIYARRPGAVANGDTGDVACDHYHLYETDIRLMRELGVRAYRFSTAWPRALPRGRGVANEPGLAFYDRLIDGLLAAGIEPWLCLYHWDLPQALDDLGGWTNRDSVGWFADYTALMARRYGDRVKRFATFNEPSVFTLFGYGFGWNAPGVAEPGALHASIHHVNLAHGAAVDVLRTLVPAVQVGGIHNRQPCLPADHSAADAAARDRLDAYWNGAFPDPQILGHYPPLIAAAVEPWVRAGDLARICRPVDWIGVNHYGPIYTAANPATVLGLKWAEPPQAVPRSPAGWQIAPAAFSETLLEVHRRYRLPIYVLENGAGTEEKPDAAGEINDTERIAYLAAYIDAMRAAKAQGADIRGYFVWSLLDNFEWGSGYGRRFGLIYVDFPTGRRIPKASARWYARLIAGAGTAC